MATMSSGTATAEPPQVEVLHRAVEAFRRREIGYRDILEDLPAAIYTTDAEGRITYFNKACVAFSGRTPRLGDDQWCVTWRLYTADGAPLAHADCPMAVALRERRPVRGVEAQAERPDGSRIAFQPYPTPILDEAGNLLGAINMLVDITEQKQAQRRLCDMAHEIDHRANNLLAVMQALLHLTKGDSVEAYRTALEGRFQALARANRLIAERRWTSVDLQSLIEEELAGMAPGRARLGGAAIEVGPAAAQCLGMMVHELATNAARHGALSACAGEVVLDWEVDRAGRLVLRWEESGGPAVVEPERTGTGSAVIAAAVRQLGGELLREWRPEGLRCTFLCAAAAL